MITVDRCICLRWPSYSSLVVDDSANGEDDLERDG
jgi:hypothetical protein